MKDRKLKYFKSNQEKDLKVPQGVFNFDQFMCFLKDDQKDPLRFSLTFLGISERTFLFKCNTKEESFGWQQELKRHIEQSEGFKNKKSGNGLKKPWQYDNISEK